MSVGKVRWNAGGSLHHAGRGSRAGELPGSPVQRGRHNGAHMSTCVQVRHQRQTALQVSCQAFLSTWQAPANHRQRHATFLQWADVATDVAALQDLLQALPEALYRGTLQDLGSAFKCDSDRSAFRVHSRQL